MIKITEPSGNIFDDQKLESLGNNDAVVEHLLVSRDSLQKNRLRANTEEGTDIGIVLEPGLHLHHGDVLVCDDKTILVEQLAEKVITVTIKDENADLMVLAGHIIGNRHRPISVNDGVISFPIQAESEIEVFEKLFSVIKNKIELKIEDMVFRPQVGADVYDH